MKDRVIRQSIRSLVLALALSVLSQGFLTAAPAAPQEPEANYLFRDRFYVSPTLKIKYDVYDTAGFLLYRDAHRGGNAEFSIVTDFETPVLEGRVLKDVRSIEDANAFLEKHARQIYFQRVPIKELPLITTGGTITPRYWVGQRSYASVDEAKAKIVEAKSVIEAGGGDFDRALDLVTEFFPVEPAPTAAEVRANFIAEEELALKVMDWLDIGEKQWGFLMGTPPQEKILWQSFGETSWRPTGLSRPNFDTQSGFWSNRVVMRGIRFMGEPTIDPYIEATWALDSGGRNFPSHLDLAGGLEYRPLSRVSFFENYNIDGLRVLHFMRSWRFFTQYIERKNITDEIVGARDTDFQYGATIFYEWGVSLDEPWVKQERTRVAHWVRDFSWGEYFGSYKYIRSNFGAVDSFNSWVLNSSLILGIKWPSFPLPRNPINDELLLMPYMRFEHTTNPGRSELTGDNRILVIAGIRWMPFRSYQFQNNEWLSLIKVFGEYVGIGKSQHPGAAEGVIVPRRDWIVGVKTSFRRF